MKTSPEALPDFHAGERALSLVELLVVIAVIAILAALLFPAIQKTKIKALDTACLSQLKQLGVATRLYAEDNNGVMPAAEPFPSNPMFPRLQLPRISAVLAPYAGKVAGATNTAALVFKCPRDNDYFFEVEGSSYRWNGMLNGQRIDRGESMGGHFVLASNDNVRSFDTNIVRPPSATVLMLDFDDFHPNPPAPGKNAVYMDGHVEPFTYPNSTPSTGLGGSF
jgi:prepilin-type N-terminal cleavage/methylation domain-containing protein/prepilin-type processing-associated H-X9-DG protein